MNALNTSTGYTPFQLRTGWSPHTLPPLVTTEGPPVGTDEERAHAVISRLENDVWEAQDNLLAAKASQASSANKHRSHEKTFQVDDLVLLATKNCRRDYMQKGDGHVAKFMPRYDGPYKVLDAKPATLTYTLGAPSVTNSVSDGPPDLHNIPYQTGQRTMGPCCVYPR
jgi:hypothetical protein